MTLMGGREFQFRPRWLHPDRDSPPWDFLESHVTSAGGRFERYESVWDYLVKNAGASIGFKRTYALGDILMLLPLARAMRRHLSSAPVTIMVGQTFLPSVASMNPEFSGQDDFRLVRFLAMDDTYGCDAYYDLDQCLEPDHRGGEASDHHRIALYARELGVPLMFGDTA